MASSRKFRWDYLTVNFFQNLFINSVAINSFILNNGLSEVAIFKIDKALTPLFRITSYNVCYTKLLRTFFYFRGMALHSFDDLPKAAREHPLFQLMSPDERLLSFNIVITSYSIHYTKLYDLNLNSPLGKTRLSSS